MFIVFNGRGWLVPLTAIGAGIVVFTITRESPAVFWCAIAASGLVDHYYGKRWNAAPPRLLQDMRTGEVLEQRPDHSFFWIPMQYWLWVKIFFAASALVAYLSRTA